MRCCRGPKVKGLNMGLEFGHDSWNFRGLHTLSQSLYQSLAKPCRMFECDSTCRAAVSRVRSWRSHHTPHMAVGSAIRPGACCYLSLELKAVVLLTDVARQNLESS